MHEIDFRLHWIKRWNPNTDLRKSSWPRLKVCSPAVAGLRRLSLAQKCAVEG